MSSRHARFFPPSAQSSGSYFLGTPARSALTWVTVSQKSSSTFSLDSPTTSILGTPASSRRTTLASGSASPVHHSWRMAKSSNRSPSSVCRNPPRRLADRDARPPLRAPVRPVVGARRGPDLPFLHLHRFHGRNTVVVLGEPVGLVTVEVDPLDAVAVAAARRHHVYRRHRRLPVSAGGLQSAISRWPRPTNRAGHRREATRRRSTAKLAFGHHCEAYHCRNYFLIMDILAINFQPLLSQHHIKARKL